MTILAVSVPEAKRGMSDKYADFYSIFLDLVKYLLLNMPEFPSPEPLHLSPAGRRSYLFLQAWRGNYLNSQLIVLCVALTSTPTLRGIQCFQILRLSTVILQSESAIFQSESAVSSFLRSYFSGAEKRQ